MTSCIGGENSEDEESLNQLLFSVLTKMSLRQLSLSDLYVLALCLAHFIHLKGLVEIPLDAVTVICVTLPNTHSFSFADYCDCKTTVLYIHRSARHGKLS